MKQDLYLYVPPPQKKKPLANCLAHKMLFLDLGNMVGYREN